MLGWVYCGAVRKNGAVHCISLLFMVYHGQAAAACESLRDLCEDCRDLLAEQAPRIIGVLQDTQAVELAVEHREHLMQGVGFVLGRLPPDAMLETVGWRLDACVGKEKGMGMGVGGGEEGRRLAEAICSVEGRLS